MAAPTKKELRTRIKDIKEEIGGLTARLAALRQERRDLAQTLAKMAESGGKNKGKKHVTEAE